MKAQMLHPKKELCASLKKQHTTDVVDIVVDGIFIVVDTHSTVHSRSCANEVG